jgi:hypothetical protein
MLLLVALPVRAQDIQLRATVDSTDYLIGEWIALHLRVEAPAEWTLRLPADDDGFANAEFVSAEDEQRQDTEKRQHISQDVVVTVFDTGRIPISAIVRYRIPGDTATYTVRSEPVMVSVRTVELDTTITYKDIREVMHVPLTVWDYLMYAGIAVLTALLAWLGYRWLRDRNGEEEPETSPEPDLPPDVIALRALVRLRDERLWQDARHKEYQSRLTDIVRAYIERRFSVPALEHPTSEIMPEVAMLGLDTALTTDLERVLRTADMCKFARYTPHADEHEEGMRFAVRFVETTREASTAEEREGGATDV